MKTGWNLKTEGFDITASDMDLRVRVLSTPGTGYRLTRTAAFELAATIECLTHLMFPEMGWSVAVSEDTVTVELITDSMFEATCARRVVDQAIESVTAG